MSQGPLQKTPAVINSLTSTSANDALSAAKGKELYDKLTEHFQVVPADNGTFAGLVNKRQVWLIIGMRVSVTNSIVLLVNRYEGDLIYVKEIVKDSNMSYQTNNVGTVTLLYSNSSQGIWGAAIRLY